MSNRKGNEFSELTRRKLAQRVAYHCSFPKCNQPTIGPILPDPEGVHIVGRACHIEAAASGGPRYNKDMSPEERKNIKNGIWCCNKHSDIIDNDIGTFSVSTLHDWKRIAEAQAFDAIDSSLGTTQVPTTLVQISDEIIVEAVWYGIIAEEGRISFAIEDYIYGSAKQLREFLQKFDSLDITKRYVVVESNGYGRILKEVPGLDERDGRLFVSFCISERTEYSDPKNAIDAKLSFSDEGTDFDIANNGGWIRGKDAVIQGVQMLLGSNRGQWVINRDFGSYLFKYYADHHSNHLMLERLIKIEISRITSIPDTDGFIGKGKSIPVSSIKWVESVTVYGHSDGLLSIDLRLYFSDDSYFSKVVKVPASLKK